MIHNSPSSPPYSQARTWLGWVMTSNLCTHNFFLWKQEGGRGCKVLAHLGVLWGHGQEVSRAVIQNGDLQSTPIQNHYPPPGYRLPASFFFFLNITGTDNSFFLSKNQVQALVQKWRDLGFTPSTWETSKPLLPFPHEHLHRFAGGQWEKEMFPTFHIVVGSLCKKEWRLCICKRRQTKEILPLWDAIWTLLGWGIRSDGWPLHQGLLWSCFMVWNI